MNLKRDHRIMLLGAGAGAILAAVYFGWQYTQKYESRLFALDAETGRVDWSVVLDDPRYDFSYYYPVAASQDRVFVYEGVGSEAKLVALDAATGRRLWLFRFNRWGTVLSPPVANENVVVNDLPGPEPKILFVLDAENGYLEWVLKDTVTSYVSQAVVLAADNRLVTITERRDKSRDDGSQLSVQALETSGGYSLWLTDIDTEFKHAQKGDPPLAANDHLVFVIGGDHRIEALDLQSGEPQFSISTEGVVQNLQLAGSMLYSYEERSQLSAHDAATGALRWTFSPPILASGNTPFIFDLQAEAETVFVVCGNEQPPGLSGGELWLFALDPANGHERWRKLLANLDPGYVIDRDRLPVFRPAIGAESVFVIMGSQNGGFFDEFAEVKLVALSTADGAELWQFLLWQSGFTATDGSRVFVADRAPRWRNWLAYLDPAWHDD